MGGKAWPARTCTGGPVVGPEVRQSRRGGLAYAVAPHEYRWCRPPTRARAWTAAACRTRLHRTSQRRVLVDPEMRPILVVVGQVLAEQAAKMLVVENDDVVEQLAPNRPHESLGHSVLPRALVARTRGLERHRRDRGDHRRGEDRVPVEHQVSRAGRPASSKGNASRSCCTTHGAVGLSVTLQCTISRRECLIANQTYRTRKVAVGTVKKSMATITSRWFRRNVSQLCLRSGQRPCCRM